jgi:hypothetical protein
VINRGAGALAPNRRFGCGSGRHHNTAEQGLLTIKHANLLLRRFCNYEYLLTFDKVLKKTYRYFRSKTFWRITYLVPYCSALTYFSIFWSILQEKCFLYEINLFYGLVSYRGDLWSSFFQANASDLMGPLDSHRGVSTDIRGR